MTRQRIGGLALAGTVLGIVAGCAQAPAQHGAAPAANAQARGAPPIPCSRPVYPPKALADKVEGTSTIGFLISAEGKVIDSRLYQSSGDASLDEAARSALAKCTFKPAVRDGRAVPAWTAVQYVWTAH